jgi:hypothetical protein
MALGLIITTLLWHALSSSVGSIPAQGLAEPLSISGQAIKSQVVSTPSSGLDSPPKSTVFNTVWVKVQRDVNTECKQCPSPSCLNQDWFGSSYQFQAICWINGAQIGNTT